MLKVEGTHHLAVHTVLTSEIVPVYKTRRVEHYHSVIFSHIYEGTILQKDLQFSILTTDNSTIYRNCMNV